MLSEDPVTSTDSPALHQSTGLMAVTEPYDDVFSNHDLTTVTGLPPRVLVFTSLTLLGKDGRGISVNQSEQFII